MRALSVVAAVVVGLNLVAAPSHAGLFDWLKKGKQGDLKHGSETPVPLPRTNGPQAWKIKQANWTQADEQNYKVFISRIGAAVEKGQCNTVKSCLENSSINPYRSSDPQGFSYYADCADFPYFMRSYFAFKNNLPFSIVTGFQARDPKQEETTDTRYPKFGSIVTGRTDFTATTSGAFPSADAILNSLLMSSISSGTFRMSYDQDYGAMFSDVYPIEISRNSVQPGAILYDPSGHVAVVYRVSEDGKIYLIDAHPDNTLTFNLYSRKYTRSHPRLGAGFKKFRPIQLVDYSVDYEGNLIGGRIVGTPNSQISDFSTEQFLGVNQVADDNWKAAAFSVSGSNYDFHDFIRARLATSSLVLNPIKEMQSLMGNICNNIGDRVTSVDLAIQNGMDRREHPKRLPENIFGASGDWENYSTPGRDQTLRILFKDLYEQTVGMVKRFNRGDRSLQYSGVNLARDLEQTYLATAKACQISYRNSQGYSVTLNLEDIRQRVFALSFDPYHCVELRWGARGQELASCPNDKDKMEWYNEEQYLRNQLERRLDLKMDYKARQLEKAVKKGVGVYETPETDLINFLRNSR